MKNVTEIKKINGEIESLEKRIALLVAKDGIPPFCTYGHCNNRIQECRYNVKEKMKQFENSLAWKMQHAENNNQLLAGPGPC